MNTKIKILVLFVLVAVLAIALNFKTEKTTTDSIVESTVSSGAPVTFKPALAEVPFDMQEVKINKDISKSFSLSEVKNIPDMEKAYGFKFSKAELESLEKNKFVIKNILDTNIVKESLPVYDNNREFVSLYQSISGPSDYKNRTQANSVFISSDITMNVFSTISAELLKETENKYLFDNVLSMTKDMYDQASDRLVKSKTDSEINKWKKVRNYLSIPYAILSSSIKPIDADQYWNSDEAKNGVSLEDMQAEFTVKDKDIDSIDNVTKFITNLKLDKESETVVLNDLKQVYDATEGRGKPSIFKDEFDAIVSDVEVTIPFTLFKPRGTYTSSSVRRQYFRAVQWYQQIPFLLASGDLTKYAVGVAELLGNKESKSKYDSMSSLISYIVGESDDLDVSDYIAANNELGKDKANDVKILAEYLSKRKPGAKIKSMPVNINPLAGVTVEEEIDALAGMRFMSQKFIPDSYWTGRLTKGDEAGVKLPGKASALQVMSILGSKYANSRFTDLPFYSDYKKAIDDRHDILKKEADGWSEKYWKSNLYTGSLWTVSGMFTWLDTNRTDLPQFMQSPLWDAKTLLTASGFWTELRHTSLLYAKQSFAEKGGGGDDNCDLRKVPEPAKGYIEPQIVAYDRLYYTANRLLAEYDARGIKLKNSVKLENYIKFLNSIREYTKLELENSVVNESVITKKRYSETEARECVESFISPESEVKRGDVINPSSRWEEIRVGLINQLRASLPESVEGPILPIKDKRTAVVADIHTDMDGGVLEEGTGVPRVMFVAVKDANGPRLTVGFTYSQYETISDTRLTDEEWQNNFYTDEGGDSQITYKPKSQWPTNNKWFKDLLGDK